MWLPAIDYFFNDLVHDFIDDFVDGFADDFVNNFALKETDVIKKEKICSNIWVEKFMDESLDEVMAKILGFWNH